MNLLLCFFTSLAQTQNLLHCSGTRNKKTNNTRTTMTSCFFQIPTLTRRNYNLMKTEGNRTLQISILDLVSHHSPARIPMLTWRNYSLVKTTRKWNVQIALLDPVNHPSPIMSLLNKLFKRTENLPYLEYTNGFRK